MIFPNFFPLQIKHHQIVSSNEGNILGNMVHLCVIHYLLNFHWAGQTFVGTDSYQYNIRWQKQLEGHVHLTNQLQNWHIYRLVKLVNQH